jgi:hypothetical protein
MARLKDINSLTLRDMITDPDYSGLADGLTKMPLPARIKIAGKYFDIPDTLESFTEAICYGQRLFIVRKETNDFGTILRMIDGYYYPLVTKLPFDEEKSLLFGKKVIACKAIQLYPVAMHLMSLTAEMVTREQTLLHREPTKVEEAAGIDKLNKYSDLTALDFLRDSLKLTVFEVLLTPYNECLVRFMLAKDVAEFQERHFELLKQMSEKKK